MESPNHHNIDEHFILTKIIESRIAFVYIYNKNIVVVEVKNGVKLSYASGTSLLLQTMVALKNRSWIYISNRIHSYSVVPTDYKHLHKINTLKGLSIVSKESVINSNPPIEEAFCKKPFKLSYNLNESMLWAAKALKGTLLMKS